MFNFGTREKDECKALSLFYEAKEDSPLFRFWDTLKVGNCFEKVRRFRGQKVPPQHLVNPQTDKDLPAAIAEKKFHHNILILKQTRIYQQRLQKKSSTTTSS